MSTATRSWRCCASGSRASTADACGLRQLRRCPAASRRGAHQVGRRGDECHQGVRRARVELRASAAVDLGHGVRQRHGRLVDAHREHRVERVAGRDDAAAERNARAGDAVRVAGAVPALVVAAGDLLGQAHHAGAAVAQDLRADQRVHLHLVELGRGERAFLEQDRVAHGDLADVVDPRRHLDVRDEAVVQTEQARDAAGQRADAQGVLARLVMPVLGGIRQPFDQLVL